MSRRLQATLLAAAVALSPIPLVAASAPAAAQGNFNVSFNIGFDYYYDQLSPYGEWYYHPRWGDVWRPVRVSRDFRPYYRGYWVNTEYGMTWETEEPWGDITYHYGRWVYDPFDGWMWVPGYTWAPSWVVWRGDGRNIGWFPMPPDDQFLAGVEVYRSDWDWNRGYFGYADWYGPSIATGLLAAWTFVALDHFADRNYVQYVVPRTQVVNIINNTTNITNYTTVNNRIVNRSVDVAQVERASGRRIERVQAERIVRTPITTVDTGRQVVMRERERHGGDVRAEARERVQRLPAQEARLPARERRTVQLRRPDQQQAQQPQGQAPEADRGGRFERRQQPEQREQGAVEPRGRPDRGRDRDREKQGAIEQPQPDRGAALQQQREEQQNRAAVERQQRDQAQQRAQAEQQQRADQQNRAAAERQQRDQAEQQNRARAEQQQRAEQQGRAREEQAARAQQAERQQQAQAEQQNRARAERQPQRAEPQQEAAPDQRQARARAKQQEEEEKRKARN